MITAQQLRDLLSYNPHTGVFIRRKNGKIAGGLDGRGYVQIRVAGERHRAHRLAWLYHAGYFPDEIDHINNIKTDNRLINLREVTHAENQLNRIDSKLNGGVRWRNRRRV